MSITIYGFDLCCNNAINPDFSAGDENSIKSDLMAMKNLGIYYAEHFDYEKMLKYYTELKKTT